MAPALPDPTEDLHWSDFSGPIHAHFAANAAELPDRRCVVETSPYREFTYCQINEASSILAHHLLRSGVQRGDVVMLYSYRGVDLVVAIMGVLKAGGTFSVIDPLYPPDRQIVYLDVAQPRALVVIKRATETAGGFSAKVTSWIAENLQLKTIVPELNLQDSGTLTGGTAGGFDVLQDAQAFKSSTEGFPVIGPDDIPTLSFTSGSEGKPKGVRGRHFSLPHYFPWMAERFGLSSNDRFTMLSGIAHDPIQRDIFTPLFLGASIWVPSSEDIQHEVLADWMAKYDTTVTHLTPAMGQILVSGATTQFPALRNAFFVGDVLIKRDVRKLQALAPNTTVINMFGTTETQRAVSYYAVRSRASDPGHLDRLPDVIPAGRGMNRVQLLVVDRANKDRICGLNEPGEIYVRAAGLAESYLKEDKLSAEKFITSWFVPPERWVKEDQKALSMNGQAHAWRQHFRGPRDRLYRSGDLGFYNEDGDVVCTGRADNQIKIRGFRVELGDIDSKLSSHNLVRENVTILRKAEEQIISYIVPDAMAWRHFCSVQGITDDMSDDSMVGLLRRYHTLREEVRTYLKTKLAVHEVPSLIIPLAKMPLNPNGKPDRPKLPFPTVDDLKAARIGSGGQLTPTELTMAEIWSEVLIGISKDTVRPEDNWMDLGGDSLKANKMLRIVAKRLHKVQQRDLYTHPTLKEFALLFDEGAQTNGVKGGSVDNYGVAAEELTKQLPAQFETAGPKPKTFFLTGATGFLGSFVLANILSRPETQVVALVRDSGMDVRQRVCETCTAYGLWSNSWRERLTCVSGDLSKPNFGLDLETWQKLSKEAEAIIHNGAKVDWLLRYDDLKAVNVQSTLTALQLASLGRPKTLTFVSSTAVLDTQHYLQLSQTNCEKGIPESDNMEGSRTGLDSGYGQTKWVSEYLMREAGRRGLAGCVIRAGYILGDSRNGASITDDFLIRMLKGAVQLRSRPPIENTINMVPVDHAAHLIVACALQATPVKIAQVTPHPRLSWNEFLGSLAVYGYDVSVTSSYDSWRDMLLQYVEESEKPGSGKEVWAATPLLDLVTSDFPTATLPRLLDDRNAQAALKEDNAATSSAVTVELVGLYVAYLVKIGFMPAPPTGGKQLPKVEIAEEQLKALKGLGGRGKV